MYKSRCVQQIVVTLCQLCGQHVHRIAFRTVTQTRIFSLSPPSLAYCTAEH